MIAALFVETNGSYFNLLGVDPWDEQRDAKKYPGPYPVIAHPPCQRWGKMWAGSPSWIAKTGERKIKGDDNGCFKSALESVRKYGGWIKADEYGGFTCCVEQGRYGHYARKPTLLYAVGVDLPELDWGIGEHRIPAWAIKKYGEKRARRIGELSFKGGGKDSSPRIRTPEKFRELLLSIVLTANKS